MKNEKNLHTQRRRHVRFPVEWNVNITSSQNISISGLVTEVSRSGITATCDAPLSAGHPCSIRLEVTDGLSSAVMYADGVVITCGNDIGKNYRIGLLLVGAEGFGAKIFERLLQQEESRLNCLSGKI